MLHPVSRDRRAKFVPVVIITLMVTPVGLP